MALRVPRAAIRSRRSAEFEYDIIFTTVKVLVPALRLRDRPACPLRAQN